MRELLDWGDHFEAQHEGCSFPRQPPAKVHIQGHADPAPAGGNAGLVSPPGTSKGRRGSLGKAVSLAGGGAAEAFCWGQEMEDKTGRQDDGREMEQVPPRTDPSPHADDKRPQSRRLFDGDESPGGGIERENGSVEVRIFGYKRVPRVRPFASNSYPNFLFQSRFLASCTYLTGAQISVVR